MDFLALYWRCMFEEAAIVKDKHGPREAYASMALLTSLVPGVFMAVLFGQMRLILTLTPTPITNCQVLFGQMRLAAMPVQGFFGESDGILTLTLTITMIEKVSLERAMAS